jgi:hypothetical protein
MELALRAMVLSPPTRPFIPRTMQRTTSLRAVVFGVAIILAGCNDGSRLATEPSSRDAGALAPAAQVSQNTLKDKHDVQIVSATGDINAAVKQYRDLLGDLNPNVKGEQPGERREINWDAVPAGFTNNDALPGDFFNATSPRGVLFTTDGSGFHISNQGYIEVNPSYAGEFNFFSPFKLFVAVGSTITDIQFVVAGSNTPAVVKGFGSVFEDVGRAHSTTIEYFDVNGKRLLKVAAPRRSDAQGLSFVGAKFDARIVARVRITAGDTPIGANTVDNVKGAGHKRDLVVMDDFIYGEPRAIIN